MNILLVTETLHAGGAETFVVRLANALARRHKVWLLNIHPELSRPELVASLSPEVGLVPFRQKARRLKQKLDGLLFRIGIDHSLLQQEVSAAIQALVSEHRIDVVHTHLFKPDYYTARLKAGGRSFRHVSTNHGDYLLYASRKPSRMLNYERKLEQAVRSLDHMVSISDQQLVQFEDFRRQFHPELGLHKILNGYEAAGLPPIDRQQLGIAPEDIVFGMVARGIPEKGWEILVRAFLAAGLERARLVLVGEGPETERLKALHAGEERIIFTGYTDNTTGYIRLFDVGVLPSYYKAESLPTVVIEYLCAGKPVLATDIGELRNMLATEAGPEAGLLIPLGSPADMEQPLQAALEKLYRDAELREELAALAPAAFRKFSMEECVRNYEAVYES